MTTPQDPTPYQMEVLRIFKQGILALVDERNEGLITRTKLRFQTLCEQGIDVKTATDMVIAEFNLDLMELTPESVARTKDLIQMGEELLQAEPESE